MRLRLGWVVGYQPQHGRRSEISDVDDDHRECAWDEFGRRLWGVVIDGCGDRIVGGRDCEAECCSTHASVGQVVGALMRCSVSAPAKIGTSGRRCGSMPRRR